METLYPNSCFTNNQALGSNNFFSYVSSSSSSTEWTKEENKLFEKALAIYDKETPDRWWNIANMAGRSMEDVIAKYRELLQDVSEIEAGRFPIPGYLMTSSSSSFAFDNDDGHGSSSRDYNGSYRKKPSSSSGGGGGRGGSSDQERKKGIPWTEDEHRRFLKGLMKYGKGDWRNISRNFVFTKTPTQVASHAQKYFIRQQQQQLLVCGDDQSKKDNNTNNKRRPSIHDITTNNININMTQSSAAPQYNTNNIFDHQKPPQQNPVWNWTNSSSSSTYSGWNWLEERALAIFRASYLHQPPNTIAPSSNALFKLQEHKQVLNLPSSSSDTLQLAWDSIH